MDSMWSASSPDVADLAKTHHNSRTKSRTHRRPLLQSYERYWNARRLCVPLHLSDLSRRDAEAHVGSASAIERHRDRRAVADRDRRQRIVFDTRYEGVD